MVRDRIDLEERERGHATSARPQGASGEGERNGARRPGDPSLLATEARIKAEDRAAGSEHPDRTGTDGKRSTLNGERRRDPSRQRLDALARLLDHRLKRAQGAAGTTNGAAGGTSKGVEDEAS